ncbi:ATPase domain-containing protein [Stigmatella sp. ncwal1]|uniref:non-specific serine/threonine protein kinase n=1 Tax=Stigmatella ashevillensis TaxID=2995309 RepID=A0ABT5DH66_9BACT|nr:ATPase domain-containing protein [Stigmatella ashevillena]MDC0712453.1 ATPase domain-containing protein [Stigmatella ashevillena]
MSEAEIPNEPVPRIPSGVQGLDTLLGGGWLHGGTYIVTGASGTGKTVLGNQFCFAAIAGGARAVYVTVLSESHGQMLAHLQPMHFFHREAVGKTLHYISAHATLKTEGLTGLSRLLFRSVREYGAQVMVVDGLAALEEHAESRLAFREFIHSLCVHNALAGCTALLLTGPQENASDPKFTTVDGIIALETERRGLQCVRGIEIQKFRGGAQLSGKHSFHITHQGLRVFPRTEALYAAPAETVPEPERRMPFGIPRLDAMIDGGLVAHSSTLLFGSPGGGKTLLGLHFLAQGAQQGESCLYYGFNETAPRLVAKAAQVGLELEPLRNRGLLRFETRGALETLPDALVDDLLTQVDRFRPQRLLIDGLEPFVLGSAFERHRTAGFLTALTHALRERRITSAMTQQTNLLFGPELHTPLEGFESIVDNILFLRFVELRSQLHRTLSVLKMRESMSHPAMHLFSITSQGVDVTQTFESAEAVLTGQPSPLTSRPKRAKRKSLPKRPARRRGSS